MQGSSPMKHTCEDFSGIKTVYSHKKKLILENCQCLKEVKLVNSIHFEDAYDLVKNLTPTIELFHISSINDKQLKILVNRCKKIKTLKLASTNITGKSLKLIIKKLKTT